MSEAGIAVTDAPDDSRLAGMVGIAAVVLFAIAVFLVPAPPKLDDGAVKVVAYFTKHDSALRVQAYLFLLATAGAFLPAAGIRDRLSRSGTSAVWTATWFGATIAVFTALIVQGAGFVALAVDPAAAGGPSSQLLYRAVIEMAPYSSCAVGISMAALAVGTLRHGAFPRPLGLYAAAFAVYEILEGLCVTGTGGALSAQGAINQLGPLLYLIAILWASIALARGTR